MEGMGFADFRRASDIPHQIVAVGAEGIHEGIGLLVTLS